MWEQGIRSVKCVRKPWHGGQTRKTWPHWRLHAARQTAGDLAVMLEDIKAMPSQHLDVVVAKSQARVPGTSPVPRLGSLVDFDVDDRTSKFNPKPSDAWNHPSGVMPPTTWHSTEKSGEPKSLPQGCRVSVFSAAAPCSRLTSRRARCCGRRRDCRGPVVEWRRHSGPQVCRRRWSQRSPPCREWSRRCASQ